MDLECDFLHKLPITVCVAWSGMYRAGETSISTIQLAIQVLIIVLLSICKFNGGFRA